MKRVSQADELEKKSLTESLFGKMNLQLFAEGGADDGDDGGDDNEADGGDKEGKDKNSDVKDKDKDKDKEGKTFDAAYVKGLREEAAKYRKEKKEFSEKADKLDAQLKAIQKALGLADEEPDAEKLSQELKKKDRALRDLKIEISLSKVSQKLDADADLTHAVLLRNGVFDDIEFENDKELVTILEKHVKEALAANPKLKGEVKPDPKKTGDDQSKDKDKKGGYNMNDLIRKAAGIN